MKLLIIVFNRKSLPDIRQRCKDFLSEVISTIFFGQHYNHPEPELITELIHMVFQEQKDEVELTASIKAIDVAPAPATRSFRFGLLVSVLTFITVRIVIWVSASA